ncbi:MAG: type IV secretion system protein VirB9 [Candidatus Deianiraeaceae bacterium]|jgi:type IV secretion system protein VirB9
MKHLIYKLSSNFTILYIIVHCLHFHSFAQIANPSGVRNVDMPINIDSRIKTLIYSPNEIYTLNLKMGFQSIVEFSIDESVELVSIGDPYPWKLTPIDRRLFIKPLQVGVGTNLTIITNKRTYLFDLKSDTTTSAHDFDVIHVVRFFYPKIPMDKSQYSLKDYISSKDGNMMQSIHNARNLSGESVGNSTLRHASESIEKKRTAVNLNYSFVGEYNEVTPIEIFDDRKDTFFRFKNNNKPPKIYSINNSGKRRLVKQKTVGDFVIIPGVHSRFHIKRSVYENYIYNDLRVNDNIEV